MDSQTILILFPFLLLVIGGNFLVINYDKRKIRDSAEQKGWTIHKISWQIFRLKGSKTQYFRVEYTDEKGRFQSVDCMTALGMKVHWDV